MHFCLQPFPTVRGCVGPHQYCLRLLRPNQGRGGLRRSAPFHRPPRLPPPQRRRTSRLGPRQHRRRRLRSSRLRYQSRHREAPAGPRHTQRRVHFHAQHHLDHQQPVPQQKPGPPLRNDQGVPTGPRQAHQPPGPRGAGRCLLGHFVPHRWQQRKNCRGGECRCRASVGATPRLGCH